MAKLTGTVTTGGAVTLTGGTSLPSWLTTSSYGVGAQVNGLYTGATNTVPMGTISSIGSSTTFQLTGATWAAGTSVALYVGKPWQAAMNQQYYNCTNTDSNGNPTSSSLPNGGGFMGADGATSIDLGPAGVSAVLWIYDDSRWGTAHNTFYSGPTLHQSVAIQGGGSSPYDMSLATVFDYYATTRDSTSPTLLIPNGFGFGGSNYFWPYGGICLNSNTILLLCLEVTVTSSQLVRTQVFWISNFISGGGVASPSAWTILPLQNPFYDGWPAMETANWYWDGSGTGWVYLQGGNTFTTLVTSAGRSYTPGAFGDAGYGLYMCRFPYTDLNGSVPTLANPQWWCGSTLGWVPNQAQRQKPTLLAEIQQASLITPPVPRTDSNGSIVARSDGTFTRILTNGVVPTLTAGGPAPVTMANVPTINTVQSTPGIDIYHPTNRLSVPAYNNAAFSYFNKAHVEQTWVGKATDDLLVSYATAPVGANNAYWPEIVRIAGT